VERVELVSCGEGALEAATRLKLPKFCQQEYFGFAAYSAHLDWIRGGNWWSRSCDSSYDPVVFAG